MVGVVFAVVWVLVGDKAGKNCRRGKNKVDCTLASCFVVYDNTRFEEKIKSI